MTMKTAAAIVSIALLAGCAARMDAVTRPLDEFGHGSWLDRVGRLPNPRVEMSDEDARALASQADRLRAQAETIRVALAAEPDRVKRERDYAQLRRLNDQIVPIERALLEAGRPLRDKPRG